jgi:hypothetical protein
MGAEEITFEELVAAEPARLGPPMSFQQLLADGFPCQGGLEGLCAIEQLPDPGPQFSELRGKYLQIVELQKRASRSKP